MNWKYYFVIIIFSVADFPFSLSQIGQFGFQPFSDQLSRRKYNALKKSIKETPMKSGITKTITNPWGTCPLRLRYI